jgi:hypothetical protein
MSRDIEVRAGLDAPHAAEDARIRRILQAYLRRRPTDPSTSAGEALVIWGPEHFGLDRAVLFRDAGSRQEPILVACAEALLRESYFIEKAGLAFCAKMILFCDTVEERQAYALMGADEAAHLASIASRIEAEPASTDVPFLALIADVLEQGGRDCLAYVLQVVLGGWGVSHYRSLAADCRDPGLARAFAAIARDEALHSETGAAVFNPRRMGDAERRMVLDVMARFLQMVRSGPQAVVAVVGQAYGRLDRAGRTALFQELEAETSTAEKLTLLRRLMNVPGMAWAIAALDGYGLFVPLSAKACAAIEPG